MFSHLNRRLLGGGSTLCRLERCRIPLQIYYDHSAGILIALRGRGQGYPWKFFLGLCGPVLQIQILYVCQPFFLYDNYNCFIASLIMLFFSCHSSYRELKQLRWWPHWRLQKNNRFNDQNNSSACASRFLVHFFDVHCTTTTWNLLIWCYMEDVDIQWRIFQPLFEPD